MPKARTNNKRLLIDASTIVYTLALGVQEAVDEVEPEYKKYKSIDESNGTIYQPNPDAFLDGFKEYINKLQQVTGTTKHKPIVVIDDSNSFRYDIYPEYKANRERLVRPAGLELYKKLIKDLDYVQVLDIPKLEADDIVVALKRHYPDKFILTAIDKDVLNSVSGKHFNYFWKEPRWVETDRITAITNKYKQTLTGDKTDNIRGLDGIGDKKAEKILGGQTNARGCWVKVKEAYIESGQFETEQEALQEAVKTLNLVDMHLLEQNKNQKGLFRLVLWELRGKNAYKAKEPYLDNIEINIEGVIDE